MTADELLADFSRRIPLSQSLGLEVVEWGPERTVLGAPFEPNRNHVDSVFGGSLYSVCALTCYALFRAITLAEGLNEDGLVIQKGAIEYLIPVRSAFQARTEAPEAAQIAQFVETYRRRGKARLSLRAEIIMESGTAAVFTGDYVLRSS